MKLPIANCVLKKRWPSPVNVMQMSAAIFFKSLPIVSGIVRRAEDEKCYADKM
jgi:hypothetical protein